MLEEAMILLILAAWAVGLGRFVFYSVTVPVPDTRWRRRLINFRALEVSTRILVIQKAGFIAVVIFIFVSRWIGDFPGRDWIAFGLYLLIMSVAWVASWWQRHIQKPFERIIRGTR